MARNEPGGCRRRFSGWLDDAHDCGHRRSMRRGPAPSCPWRRSESRTGRRRRNAAVPRGRPAHHRSARGARRGRRRRGRRWRDGAHGESSRVRSRRGARAPEKRRGALAPRRKRADRARRGEAETRAHPASTAAHPDGGRHVDPGGRATAPANLVRCFGSPPIPNAGKARTRARRAATVSLPEELVMLVLQFWDCRARG